VKNTGNTTLTNISIDDPKVNVKGSIETLLPGEEDNNTFKVVWENAVVDSDNYVRNQATVHGLNTDNENVEDLSDDNSYTEDSETKVIMIGP